MNSIEEIKEYDNGKEVRKIVEKTEYYQKAVKIYLEFRKNNLSFKDKNKRKQLENIQTG